PLNDADIEHIKEITDIQLEDARTELERANATAHAMSQRVEESDVDDMKAEDDDEDSAWDVTKDVITTKRNGDLSNHNLDMYDEEDDGPASTFGPFTGIKGLQFYRDDDDDDPYITLKEDDDELQREENEVLLTDNMCVTAIVEQNQHAPLPRMARLSSLSGYCQNRDTEDPASRFGSYVVIGTLDPEIEIFSIGLTIISTTTLL
ncbi:hypothetical protein V8E53_009219, partial [Lactarius tabidus]